MRLDTVYPADSAEFCPHPAALDILVCGTYKLIQDNREQMASEPDIPEDASSQRRIGKCLVLKLTHEHLSGGVETVQELDMPAVLDMKWSYANATRICPLVAIADSEGHVQLLQWNGAERRLQKLQNIRCRSSDTLCLSLDWSDRRTPRDIGSIIVSCSDGTLSLLAPQADGSFTQMKAWQAHGFESWIAAWNYWDTNIIYSGGDDLKLKGWDIRQNVSTPTFVNQKFDAGVTAIQNHPHLENIIAVGSYDAIVRIFDVRKPLTPLMEANVGGGAWRVKWHPSAARSTDLLVACMHDGFKVLRFSPLVSSGGYSFDAVDEHQTVFSDFELVKRFDEHESLAYGVDWSHDCSDCGEGSLVVSSSFYDHDLRIWKG